MTATASGTALLGDRQTVIDHLHAALDALEADDHVADRVRGREEVVIKALPPTLRGLPGYAGASLVGDGRMALILDIDALLKTGLRGNAPRAKAFK